MRTCTCRWSRVNTTTIDPPHIVHIDPDCPDHGHHTRAVPGLGEFTAEERDELLMLMALFKNQFAAVACEMLHRARRQGIPESAACAAIVSECLLLAGSLYGGDREGFLKVASRAHHDAEIVVAHTRTQ